MKSTYIFLALGLLLLTFGCTTLTGTSETGSDQYYGGTPTKDYGTSAEYAPSYSGTGETSADNSRMVILSGSLSLSVPEGTLDAKLSEVKNIMRLEGAETTGMQYYESQSSKSYLITMKIAPGHFDSFVEKLKDVGTIESMNTDLTDVTEQYTDLETRISNLETELTRLNALYEKAENISDMLEIEREITRVTTELEIYKQQKLSLENQVEKSTITLEIKEEKGAVDTGLVIPLQQLGEIFFGALSFGIMIVVGIAGFGIPIAIALFIIYKIAKFIWNRTMGKKPQAKAKGS